ncbi:MAG: AraC family ligand binding domain-containing protein, partial [Niameybacter sp.]
MDIKIDFLNKNRYNIDLNLYTCGHESCPSGMCIGPTARYHYIIHYVLKGTGTFKIDNRVYKLKPGQGFLIEPDVITTYESDDKDPWEYMWVGFVGSKAPEYLKRANLSSASPIFTYKKGEALETCLAQMIQNLNRSPNNDILLIANLYEFMYLLVDNNEQTTDLSTLGAEKQTYIEQAMLYCEHNF